ncbi:RNA-directed DNA polymerase from mobile element jockey [Eumeta japonica]|uniref:RNA-directed DNA polymerase from mobile element jockey n=1 Tax=Eumeta variegata TaxID=151549 RepID=A0A4C1XBD2_EUMVA|nr:RNA-directed DNA polymerase from mobile element jockey [Eumeta japonica]
MAAKHNQGCHTAEIFLDIEKAFDRVWHSGVLHKLLVNTQIPSALVRTVVSFLGGARFFVAVEDVTSDPRPICAGVLQGIFLSPCLYAVFTDDISTHPDQLQDCEEDVMLTLYADDSAYLALFHGADLSVAKVQGMLLPDWLDKWRVTVNVTKTATYKSTNSVSCHQS